MLYGELDNALSENITALEILILLAKTNDGEVFEFSIDALRDFSLDKIKEDDKVYLMEKLNEKIVGANQISKIIFEEFQKNLY